MESDIKSPIHQLDGEYIREWLVLGPFFPDDLSRDFLADAGGEANIEPKEGDTVATEDGRELTWRRYESEQKVVDLLDAIGHHGYATAYAFCILSSDTEGDAQFCLGSDDGVSVWVNGKRVHTIPNPRPFSLDEDVFWADLESGANRCLIKVFQISGGWGFSMRTEILPSDRAVISGTVTDQQGEPVYNASVLLEQDGAEVGQTMTDSSGNYVLAIRPGKGTYNLSASSGHLGAWQLAIRLSERERQTVNLKLEEAASIEGTLLMPDDATPHVAVPVQAIRDGEVMATTLSNEGGRYQFINLKPGCYQICCQVLGGYVHYGEDRGGKRESQRTGKPEGWTSSGKPMILQVGRGEILTGIDLRFADFKKGTWRKYAHSDGLPCMTVYKIYRDPDSVMWFGTVGGGVSRYDGKNFVSFTTRDGLADNVVWAVHRDPDGVMWFGTRGGGVSRYDGREFVNLTTEHGLAHNWVWGVVRDPDGVMWFGTAGGLSRYDGTGFVNFTRADGLPDNWVYSLYCDPDGLIWCGIMGGGVCRYDRKVFTNFTTKDGLVNNNVNAVQL